MVVPSGSWANLTTLTKRYSRLELKSLIRNGNQWRDHLYRVFIIMVISGGVSAQINYNGDERRLLYTVIIIMVISGGLSEKSNYNNRDQCWSHMFIVTIIIGFSGGAAVNNNCNGNQWLSVHIHK